jgi:acetylornithine deacetylase/succinyl-diaminopimelate desuccinylase-like protein
MRPTGLSSVCGVSLTANVPLAMDGIVGVYFLFRWALRGDATYTLPSMTDADFQTAQAELIEWLNIPSVSTLPERNADTRRAAEWLHGKLNGIGLNTQVLETAGHPVVYAEHLHAPGAPTVLLYGHYDVQPADPLNEWTTDPFNAAVRDGAIFARGSTDDKGQVYAHVKALELMLRDGGKLPVNLKLLIEGEEEIGSPNLKPFVEAHTDLLRCDVVVISDGSMFAPGVPTLTTGLRGLCYLEVHVQGAFKDLHSGGYGGAVANPIQALAQIIQSLRDGNGKILVPGVYDTVRAVSDTELEGWRKLPFSESDFAKSVHVDALPGEPGYSVLERLWARPTLEINGIWGGFQGEGSKTVLPAKAGAKISLRLVPDQQPDEIFKLVERHILSLRLPGVTVEVKKLNTGNPVLVDADSPAAQAALRAIGRAYPGKDVSFVRTGGSIPVVSTFRDRLEAPVLLVDYGLPDDGAHGPDERFTLECLKKGIEVSTNLYEELARLKI